MSNRTPQTQESIERIENRLKNIEKALHNLEEYVYWRSSLFYKAFEVVGTSGDFVEFGVFRGVTLSNAYWCAQRHRQLFSSGAWDHSSTGDATANRNAKVARWDAVRFFGFDSFEGIPDLSGPDADRPVFGKGTYAASQEEAETHLKRCNVNLDRVVLVKGFFSETCTLETAEKIGLKRIGIAHIDSDLYESATTALDFCTPFFTDGAVVIFDEWFQFGGSPNYGEQRAFREWLERNPGWHAAELAREGGGRIAFILTRR